MYLYDKKRDKLDIYSLIPDDEKLYEYRVEQMNQIKEDQKVVRAVTGMGNQNYEIFKYYRETFDTKIIPIKSVNGLYHKLEPDKSRNKDVLLNSYYSGNLRDRKIARVRDLKRLRYFLLNKTEYINYPWQTILEGIIEVPESLYLLSLIEQEKYSLIGDKDVSKQLSLFSVHKLDRICLKTVEMMDNMCITQGCYRETIKKAENDAHLLKLILK